MVIEHGSLPAQPSATTAPGRAQLRDQAQGWVTPRFIAAFESTYLPRHGVDLAQATGHAAFWKDDLDSVATAGITSMRYAMPWHRIEAEPGRFDWDLVDAQLDYLREIGVAPIVDLLHHTSYPEWLTDGFRDRRFHSAYVGYASTMAERYPWIPAFTLFNEPFATLFLSGHEALWPPYDSGIPGFVRLATNVLQAVAEASGIWNELLPDARHVWIDTCEHHSGTPGAPAGYAAVANDRRHVLLDLATKTRLDADRPFLNSLLDAGGEALLQLPAIRVDMLGLDYYCHSEWWYDERGSFSPSPHPLGFAALAEQYGLRYGLPMMLSETNLRGLPTDRASWLRYMLEQYELAVSRGVPLEGFCWFPYVDSCDWDSLLARSAGRVDPVGVVSLGPGNSRVRTSMTAAWEAAAAGAAPESLPAYRFQPPCDMQLRGLLPQMESWGWQDPPTTELVNPALVIDDFDGSDVSTGTPDLVVLSHLRWSWVWQRPQHLVSRFAVRRRREGASVWFVEEPVAGEVEVPQIRTEDIDGITRLWLVVPFRDGQPEFPGFDEAPQYGELLKEHLDAHGVHSPDALLYTPMARDAAMALEPRRLCYDVMDDLASFKNAATGLKAQQEKLLNEADVVFAGGRSLHRGISERRSGSCHLFPSGVDAAHYQSSRELRSRRTETRRNVAGYVGVIDERLDLDLLTGLAEALPSWTIRVVGPVAKINPGQLPRAANIEYLGMANYADLPGIMADFDVALMPFALNEATRSISPTKTLEYLAAGLPVISTRVADVVSDYTGVVHFADTASEFASACETVVTHSRFDRDTRVDPILRRYDWDLIAEAMDCLVEGAERREPVPSSRARDAEPTVLVRDMERAHRQATGAAAAGLQDAGLAGARLAGPSVPQLAEAGVTSATPFVRAPLLARLSAARLLHPVDGDDRGRCTTCGTPAPCDTAVALHR
jgi:beta-glucosidase/6-phospho-beta-glucosidase/beta-galactosidase/glycosyltransferase involved in cell wall biosynthesis